MAGKKFLVIVGPTASGKTELAHKIARDFCGDIITADSRQVYQEMNIGTAKPHLRVGKSEIRSSKSEFFPCPDIENVRHYGIDLVKPNRYFSVQQWKKMALHAINEIQKRKRLPIIEGGTWQWIYALVYDYTIPEVAPNKKLRAELQVQIRKGGLAPLVKKVLAKDPEAATFLDIHNPRRVIRALEVMAATKKPFSQLRQKGALAFEPLLLGIDKNRANLEKRMTQRLKQQLRQGLQQEATQLAKKYGWKAPGMSGIGYREWRPYVKGNVSLEDAQTRILCDTIKLAKVQRRMFGKIKSAAWVRGYKESKRIASAFVNK